MAAGLSFKALPMLLANQMVFPLRTPVEPHVAVRAIEISKLRGCSFAYRSIQGPTFYRNDTPISDSDVSFISMKCRSGCIRRSVITILFFQFFRHSQTLHQICLPGGLAASALPPIREKICAWLYFSGHPSAQDLAVSAPSAAAPAQPAQLMQLPLLVLLSAAALRGAAPQDAVAAHGPAAAARPAPAWQLMSLLRQPAAPDASPGAASSPTGRALACSCSCKR